jgi:hypothetical protein
MHDETNPRASSRNLTCQGCDTGSSRRNRRIVVPRYGGPDVLRSSRSRFQSLDREKCV